MKTTQQLYGVNPEELANMTYKSALVRKLQGAEHKLDLLLSSKPLYSFTSQDSRGQKDLEEAIKFNKFLLEEIMHLYPLEGKSIHELNELKALVSVHPELTFEEKKANLSRINQKLNPSLSVQNALKNCIEGQSELGEAEEGE